MSPRTIRRMLLTLPLVMPAIHIGWVANGCDVLALSFTTPTNRDAGWTAPAKVGAVNGSTLTNALTMGVGAANASQGASSTASLATSP